MTKRTEWQEDSCWPAEEYSLLYCVTYCSRSTAFVDDAAISQIVAAAQQHNKQQGITGLLAFGEGVFLQWLEGPREQVTLLMSRIRRDPRHTNVHVFSEWEDVRERVFPDWAMEHVHGELIRDVLTRALDAATEISSIEMLRRLLKSLDAGGLAALTIH